MGRESSKESREFKHFNLLWTSSSSSSSSPRFLLGETTSFSSSLLSGVPIDDELADESPAKNTLPVGRSPAYGGGDDGTSMAKVGPTRTSMIIARCQSNRKRNKTQNNGNEQVYYGYRKARCFTVFLWFVVDRRTKSRVCVREEKKKENDEWKKKQRSKSRVAI